MGKKGFGDEIMRVAYDLYEKGGCVHGYHLEHWLEAERIVLERHTIEIKREPSTIEPAKGKKASHKTQTKTSKTDKRISESSSRTKATKSPSKHKI